MTDRDEINKQVEIEKATREALHVNFENIPEPLRLLPYWVGWKYSLDEKGNLKKPPFNLRTGKGASHSNPATWSEFETAKEAYQEGQYTGIGYVLTGQGLVVIDLDHCVNEDGTLNKKAQGVVDYLGSYAELSPSGRGIHIFVFAHLPGPGRKLSGYEMYEDKRYITITGHHIDSSPLQIAAEQEKLTQVYNRIFTNKTDNTIPQRTLTHAKQRVYSRQSELNLQEQADRIIAYGIKTNTNFRRYFEGDETLWGDGKVSPTKSEADWKLCLMLAYRTYPKRDQRLERIALMDEIFRQSRLYDEKWDSRREHTTYGMITIEKAIDVNDEEVEKKQRS